MTQDQMSLAIFNALVRFQEYSLNTLDDNMQTVMESTVKALENIEMEVPVERDSRNG